MQLIDGRKVSEEIYQSLKVEVDKIKAAGGKAPHLAAVFISETILLAKLM